ncbi:MAG: tRNA pseudouridine(13) synthase TruD, partial [Pseudomonadales bacterium]|nr:tRNA pseudouridine(13) synthase TruD [Pseudomonadales bacterium]
VGYAGMKDRRANTTQWFSARIPVESEAKLADLENSELTVLETQRNERKLKIGSHKSNHFSLRLREVEGNPEQLDEKLRWLQQFGVPNYFGKQRFGRDLSNLQQVQALMSESDSANKKPGRQKRGMLYSAARAYLFNQILSQRLMQGNWNQYVAGDVLNLNGTQRFFAVESSGWDAELQQRLDELDIHPSGLLCGQRDESDRYATQAIAADIEDAVLAHFPDLVGGLERHGLRAGRRSLRFKPEGLNWQWHGEAELELQFSLPRGAYATSLLRELCQFREQANSNTETPQQECSQK